MPLPDENLAQPEVRPDLANLVADGFELRGPGPIVELPINYVGSEYRYLLRATEHHEAIINGVSGFTPPLTARLTEMSKSEPIPDAFIDELRKINTRFVIGHADALGDFSVTTREWIKREMSGGRLVFVRRFDRGIRGDWLFSLHTPTPRSNTPDAVRTFLEDGWTRNESTFGFTEPVSDTIAGPARFSGWAFSPDGIRQVDLLFDNGAVRVPAMMIQDRRLSAAFPWYPKTPRPRFVAEFRRRPPEVRRKTDVQAEVTDGRGRVIRLENLWFEWE